MYTISDTHQSQCQCQKSIGRIEEQQAWHPVQGKSSNRRTNNVYVIKNNVTSDEKDDGDGDAHFTIIVHQTLGDVSRRKRNTIVSGLPEEEKSGADDRQTFLEFCSAFLPIKPSLLDVNCCSRIGKASPHRPRKLLVRLNSEESAAATYYERYHRYGTQQMTTSKLMSSSTLICHHQQPSSLMSREIGRAHV